MRRILRTAFVLAAVLPINTVLADISGLPHIIDGDTLKISDERIRLHGIDAPETNQSCMDVRGNQWSCGRQSTSALASLIDGRPIICKGRERDRYRRLIAVCFAGSKDLNAEMVRQGWALAYRKYSTDYVVQETVAKSERVGIWAGQFVSPWEWRRGKRLTPAAVKSCCKICRKGKACGNSCIRRTYTCQKAPGCACNAN